MAMKQFQSQPNDKMMPKVPQYVNASISPFEKKVTQSALLSGKMQPNSGIKRQFMEHQRTLQFHDGHEPKIVEQINQSLQSNMMDTNMTYVYQNHSAKKMNMSLAEKIRQKHDSFWKGRGQNQTLPHLFTEHSSTNLGPSKQASHTMLQANQSKFKTNLTAIAPIVSRSPIIKANKDLSQVQKSFSKPTKQVQEPVYIREIIDETTESMRQEPILEKIQLTNSLYQGSPVINKPAFPVVSKTNTISILSTPIHDFEFNNYINLMAFPMYMQNPFLLYLKATSLFNNSLILENPMISIFCKTVKFHYDKASQINLTLTYHANVPGLILTTSLKSYDSIESQPVEINQHPLTADVEQTFVYRNFNFPKVIDFPDLTVQLTYQNMVSLIKIPLPFSINKYIQSMPISAEDVAKYLSMVT